MRRWRPGVLGALFVACGCQVADAGGGAQPPAALVQELDLYVRNSPSPEKIGPLNLDLLCRLRKPLGAHIPYLIDRFEAEKTPERRLWLEVLISSIFAAPVLDVAWWPPDRRQRRARRWRSWARTGGRERLDSWRRELTDPRRAAGGWRRILEQTYHSAEPPRILGVPRLPAKGEYEFTWKEVRGLLAATSTEAAVLEVIRSSSHLYSGQLAVELFSGSIGERWLAEVERLLPRSRRAALILLSGMAGQKAYRLLAGQVLEGKGPVADDSRMREQELALEWMRRTRNPQRFRFLRRRLELHPAGRIALDRHDPFHEQNLDVSLYPVIRRRFDQFVDFYHRKGGNDARLWHVRDGWAFALAGSAPAAEIGRLLSHWERVVPPLHRVRPCYHGTLECDRARTWFMVPFYLASAHRGSEEILRFLLRLSLPGNPATVRATARHFTGYLLPRRTSKILIGWSLSKALSSQARVQMIYQLRWPRHQPFLERHRRSFELLLRDPDKKVFQETVTTLGWVAIDGHRWSVPLLLDALAEGLRDGPPYVWRQDEKKEQWQLRKRRIARASRVSGALAYLGRRYYKDDFVRRWKGWWERVRPLWGSCRAAHRHAGNDRRGRKG